MVGVVKSGLITEAMYMAEDFMHDVMEQALEDIIAEKIKLFPQDDQNRLKERTYDYFKQQIKRSTNRVIELACE